MKDRGRSVAVAGALAAVVWAALVLQLYLIVAVNVEGGLGAAVAVVRFFTFFTILTNIFIALVLSLPLISRESSAGRFFARPVVTACAAASISLVSVVYSLLLRELWSPTGLQKLADALLHDVTPIAFVAYWWLALPKGALGPGDPFRWAAYPLAYFAYALASGAITGWYRYPFIDVSALGYGRTLLHAVLFLVGFIALGFALRGLGRLAPR